MSRACLALSFDSTFHLDSSRAQSECLSSTKPRPFQASTERRSVPMWHISDQFLLLLLTCTGIAQHNLQGQSQLFMKDCMRTDEWFLWTCLFPTILSIFQSRHVFFLLVVVNFCFNAYWDVHGHLITCSTTEWLSTTRQGRICEFSELKFLLMPWSIPEAIRGNSHPWDP